MLLEVVALARDVGGDFHAVGEAYASNFADSGVGLAGSLGRNARAHAALERCRVEGRAIFERIKTAREPNGARLFNLPLSPAADELINCRHTSVTVTGMPKLCKKKPATPMCRGGK